MEANQQLYVVTIGEDRTYNLHRIEDRQSSTSSLSQLLPRPLFQARLPQYPDFMSFAAVGSCIFMVGGAAEVEQNGHRRLVVTNQVFIFDLNTSTCRPGPSMNACKNTPHLITVGNKLFALSNKLNFRDYEIEGRPRFEMLDTDNLHRGWTALTLPPSLDVSRADHRRQLALATLDDHIFASAGDSGTWAFNVNNLGWFQVSQNGLPFSDCAVSVPNVSGVCCGYSVRSRRFCAYRIQLGQSGLVINEFGIDDSDTLPPLSPSLECCGSSFPVVFNDGRVYFVDGGVDEPETYDSPAGNQYVQVYAHRLSQRQILRRCRHMRGDDDDDETGKDLKLRALWSQSFFGGPSCDPYFQVVAAFAI